MFDLNSLIEQVLNINDDIARYSLIGILSLGIFCIIFRILICFSYKAQSAIFKMNAKEVHNIADLKPYKYNLLNKIVKDFRAMGEKGISNIDTGSIVKRHLLSIRFLGINMESLSGFIKGLESGFLFIGLILAVIFDYPAVFGTAAISFFIIFNIFSVIFNFDIIRENLAYDIESYVNREIGQYYIGDFTSAIQRLKVELVVAIANQANVFSDSVKNISAELNKGIGEGMLKIADSVNLTMESLSKFSSYLDEPLSKWKNAVENAYESQKELNLETKSLKDTLSSFENVSNKLINSVETLSKSSEAQSSKISEQIHALINSSENIDKKYEELSALSLSVKEELSYLTENQKILKTSLESYEEGLKSITVELGEALGSIISHHVDTSYYELNEDLKDNIKMITMTNAQVIDHIDKAFEELQEQSKAYIQTLAIIKDEILKIK